MTQRVLWLDAPGGAAGDMILAALIDAGAPVDDVRSVLDALDLSGWDMQIHPTARCSVTAKRVSFIPTRDHAASLSDEPQSHTHAHTHTHVHGHTHDPNQPTEPVFPGQPERSWRTIRDLLAMAAIPDAVKNRATDIFRRLAEAEARVHGGRAEDVHFHEVGSVDAILDIVGVCAAIHTLGVDVIHCGPLPIGRGWVRCAHGKMPVPAPATMYLMEGWPTVPGIDGVEQVTPTGAAVWVSIGRADAPPAFTVQAVGYGAGTRELDDRPNVVRAVIGHTTVTPTTVTTTLAQVDDMTGEHIPPLIQQLLASGALDVTVTPTIMKKGRPGLRVEAISRPLDATRVAHSLLQHASTFGIRQWDAQRTELDRWHETVQTPFGTVRIKVGALAGETVQAAPEFDDVAACAQSHAVPVARVHAAALHAWHCGQDSSQATP